MTKRQHELHRQRQLARYTENSRAARDVAPIPPIRDAVRRGNCKHDLERFLRTYFAASYPLPFSVNHKQFISRLQEIVTGGGSQCIAMPRGTGKTTIVRPSMLWATLNSLCRYVLIISATSSESKANLDIIKAALLTNDTLLEDYPEVCHPIRRMSGSSLLARGQIHYGRATDIRWEAKRIKFPTIAGSRASGNTIASYGITSSIRGTSESMPDGSIQRPDFLMLDDLQRDDLAINPARVEKMEGVINSTLLGLSSSDKTISAVMCCTVLEDGDLADRYLNREIYPTWQGLRFKAIETMPERMDLWRGYKTLLFDDPALARDFYRANKSDMQRGAVVSWAESYDPDSSEDALQHNMNRWALNERAFWSEYQNTPLKAAGAAIQVPARVIAGRYSNYPRDTAPPDTARIVAFCDVHDDILYYVITAFTHEGTAYVIDYNTFPEQSRRYFAKGDSGLETLALAYGGTVDGALQQGVELVASTLAARTWKINRGQHTLDLLLIDAKYKPEVIEEAIRRVGLNQIAPCRGIGIKATNNRMETWKHKSGRHYGFHWLEETLPGRQLASILSDTNYWKSRVHESLALYPGEKGSLSFFGTDKDGDLHRLISDHCNAEAVKLVTANGNVVHEWNQKPNQPDNHYFDCVTGCFVAASVLGIGGTNNAA